MSAKLDWLKVDSSNVEAVAHDPLTDTLAVKFRGGGLYSYTDVDVHLYTALAFATSVGQYFNSQIKGVHPYTKWVNELDLIKELNSHRV